MLFVMLMSYSPASLSPHFFPPLFLTFCFFPLFFQFTTTPPSLPWLRLLFPWLSFSGSLCLSCHSPCRLVFCGFCTDSGSALREGLVLDLQSQPIMLSSFKQLTDNRKPPSQPLPPIRLTISILLWVSMENAVCRWSLDSLC